MSSPALPFHLINAFVLPSSPHSGNQAGVVVFPSASHPKAKDDVYMLLVARDFNFAETAFVYPLGEGEWSLRWFTPEVEVELCGHATLAASCVLLSLNPKFSTLLFQTLSGQLIAERSGEEITITLPINLLEASSSDEKILSTFCSASGVEKGDVVQVTPFRWGSGSIIFELKSDVDLVKLEFDTKALMGLSEGLIIVTQMRSGEHDGKLKIDSRVFAPGLGVDEDSVTGAAHAVLTGYYLGSPVSSRFPKSLLQGKDVKTLEIEARQLSVRGGGLVSSLDGAKARITGRAVEMGRGTLAVLE